mmetsp:Transcript_75007/g.243804  ORF Transcript_75007/g.243804 Transcript_75007/m.243804 type:complete len:230 (-) Transcript_75007:451-1140(-)
MGCRAADGQPCTLLLSRVRPLLEREHQINVDESTLGFLNEDGAFVRLNKLKHLVHALLKWRDQRQAWQRSRQLEGGAMDRLLEPHLQLLASGPGSDLVLRCFPGGASAAPAAAGAEAPTAGVGGRREEASWACGEGCRPGFDELQLELERLRAENLELRAVNQQLQEWLHPFQQAVVVPMAHVPAAFAMMQLPNEALGFPSEPPPQVRALLSASRSTYMPCRYRQCTLS